MLLERIEIYVMELKANFTGASIPILKYNQINPAQAPFTPSPANTLEGCG